MHEKMNSRFYLNRNKRKAAKTAHLNLEGWFVEKRKG